MVMHVTISESSPHYCRSKLFPSTMTRASIFFISTDATNDALDDEKEAAQEAKLFGKAEAFIANFREHLAQDSTIIHVEQRRMRSIICT
uniref:Uncharacterized protein n=1 Tax=Oryza meridionalis TaxID=40149 RepID=A0A0E0DV93_9ORYZ